MGKGDARVAGLILLFGIALAVLFSFVKIGATSDWAEVDSLIYEAQKVEVMGQPREAALDQVLSSDIARENFDPALLEDRAWLDHLSSFFRRRWTVPVVAAALDPVFGVNSLREASLFGWALLAPLLFLLLRRRFSVGASVLAAAACMVLPPVLMWARAPMTDTWALAMLVLCLLLALLARDDLRWLPVWIAAALIGSFTRDLALVLILATGWVALAERSRKMALVLAPAGP